MKSRDDKIKRLLAMIEKKRKELKIPELAQSRLRILKEIQQIRKAAEPKIISSPDDPPFPPSEGIDLEA